MSLCNIKQATWFNPFRTPLLNIVLLTAHQLLPTFPDKATDLPPVVMTYIRPSVNGPHSQSVLFLWIRAAWGCGAYARVRRIPLISFSGRLQSRKSLYKDIFLRIYGSVLVNVRFLDFRVIPEILFILGLFSWILHLLMEFWYVQYNTFFQQKTLSYIYSILLQ